MVVGRIIGPNSDAEMSKALDPSYYWRRTGAVRESNDRMLLQASIITTPASGSTYMVGLTCFAGDVLSNIVFASGTTPWSGGGTVHRFFTLYDKTGALLAYTADDGANAWGANAEKSLAIAFDGAGLAIGSYKFTATDIYYLGIVHAFGSGAGNTFEGGPNSTPINTTLAAAQTPYRQCLVAGALTAGLPTNPLVLVWNGNRPYCYFT